MISEEKCAIADRPCPLPASLADASSIISVTVLSSPRRLLTLAAVITAALASLPAYAQASDLWAAPGGSAGPVCSNSAAPCTIAAALLAARSAPGADVVNLAPGTYAEVIAAVGDADTDVTIRGAGQLTTTIAGAATDAPVVQLGAIGTGTMALEDVTIDGSQSNLTSTALRSRLAKLTLTRVRVLQTGVQAKLVPAIDADATGSELVLDQAEVLANTQAGDPAIGAVNAGGTLTIRDSKITTTAVGDTAAVYARGNTTIQRSTLTHGEANAGYALRFSNTTAPFTIVVDSTVLKGGNTAARFDVGTGATTIALRGDTISPAVASNGYAVNVNPSAGGSQATATINSSLVLTRGVRIANGAQATCTYSNLPTVGFSGSPNCPTADFNPNSNTKLMLSELRLDPDLAPLFDSPAVDSGDPAGVAAGESPGDRLGRLRAGSSADVCDAGPGVRDKGAYERYRPLPSVAITGPDSFPAGTATFGAVTNSRDPVFAWVYGDGADGGTGGTTSRAFGRGSSSVKLTVGDRVFNCANAATKSFTITAAAGAAAADKTAPKLTKVKLAKSKIKRKQNATLRFTLSEAATVTVTAGRVKGKKLVGSRKVSFKGKKGANSVKLTAKKLKWRKARYGLKVGAKDAAGNSAKSVSLRLSVR